MKEGNALFNNQHIYLQLYGIRHVVKDHSAREETCFCHYMGCSFRLAVRVLLYAPSHRQDSTYHGLCYISREAPECIVGSNNLSGSILICFLVLMGISKDVVCAVLSVGNMSLSVSVCLYNYISLSLSLSLCICLYISLYLLYKQYLSMQSN